MPTSKYEHDLPENSRALAEDPAGYMPLSELPPLPPVQRQQQQSASILSPLIVLVGVFLLLMLLTTGILRTIDDAPTQTTGFSSAPNPISCAIIADQDVNVHEGPGFDYERAWILPTGRIQWAIARTDDQWYQVENGWVLAENVRLTSQTACAALEVARVPRIFDDEITLPDEVEALGWRLILNESFATNANQWRDATSANPVIPMEGALSLASGMMQVAPILEEHSTLLKEAYYTFRVSWAASEPNASLIFTFQSSSEGSYQLEMKQNGSLVLSKVDTNGILPLPSLDNYLPQQDDTEFIVGILNHEGYIRVYINNVLVLTDENILEAGTYSFSLRGRGSVTRINRLDIRVP